MVNEKQNYQNLPIPSYEEAIADRPSSSQSHRLSDSNDHDAERETLLRQSEDRDRSDGSEARNGANGRRRYEPPTVESARTSLDLLSESGSRRSSTEELRREMEEGFSSEATTTRPSRLRQNWSRWRSSVSRRLPSIKWPAGLEFIPETFHEQWEKQGCVLVIRFFALILVGSLIYVLFMSDLLTFDQQRVGQMYDPESVRMFVQSQINETNIESYLEYVTRFPHIAGSEGSYILGKWMEDIFKEASLEDVHMERFDVYLNYPTAEGRRVAIIDPPEKAWVAKLDEDQVYKDPFREQTFAWHGNSWTGNVTGPLVYANYGSREDFAQLKQLGISLEGAIVLVRYYGTQGDRALKIKAAELAGAKGCLIYSDPQQDGFVVGAPWPDGRYRPADGVQRGGVSLMSWVTGDILSPGWASLPDEDRRLDPAEAVGMNHIPSLPLAWRDAKVLLESLQGHGQRVEGDWTGGVPIAEWWTGNAKAGESSPTVHLMNFQDENERQPIYNVIGRFTGIEQPDKKIVIGNHRDSWCFGGADPGSGTAVMAEVVRVLGELYKLGWRPLRTIEFASWDAEEYNLVGSSEHVEAEIKDLRLNGYAYINVDVAVSGDKFAAAGSPVFQKALYHVLDRVSDPNHNKTLRELWDASNSRLEGLGAGSDYVAFQDIAGTSSVDLRFDGPLGTYHSCYENFEWMTQFGDPGFVYHKLFGQFWVLFILELSDRPILPFDMSAYGHAAVRWITELQTFAESEAKKQSVLQSLDVTKLQAAADSLIKAADQFHEWEITWSDMVYATGGFENNVLAVRRMSHNNRMANFETHLLDLDEGGGVCLFLSFVLRCRKTR